MFPPLLKGLYLLLPLAYIHTKLFNIPVQSIMLIFFGIDAKDLLIKMLKSPNCIDGCKVVSMPPKKKQKSFQEGCMDFRMLTRDYNEQYG
jgi:hypothetical protein